MPKMADTAKSTIVLRHHVSTACVACRRSKIKCDGRQPTCSQCVLKKRRCVLDSSVDKRKISLRKSVQAFTNRVHQLEQFIVAQGLEVPLPDAQHASTIDSLTAAYQCPQSCETISPALGPVTPVADPPTQQENSQQKVVGNTTQQYQPYETGFDSLLANAISGYNLQQTTNSGDVDVSTNFDADWILGLTSSNNMYGAFDIDATAPPTTFSYVDNVGYTQVPLGPHGIEPNTRQEAIGAEEDISSDDEDHKEVTYQISDRIGTLLNTDKGSWRYYGATSDVHLSKDRYPFRTKQEAAQQQHARISAQLNFLGLDHPCDPGLTRHLIKLYFTWQNPSLHIVDREAFEQAQNACVRTGEKTTFYTQFLVNAICAVGATFEDHIHTDLPRPLPEHFANRAKAILDIELDDPQVATVQGLAVLSSYEAAATRDSRAWVLSGMAIRLALDLGLHLSNRKHVKEGKMTTTEANARNDTMWGCYFNDCGCGLYLGRPSYTNIKDIASDKPLSEEFNSMPSFWTEYVSSCEPGSGLSSFHDPQAMLRDRWIALYDIMSTLGYSMYVSTNTSKVELQALGQHTFDQLLTWRSTLPKELDLDMASLATDRILPHILVLHMYFSMMVIILHRPFCSKNYIQPHPLIGPGAEHAREMCVKYACDIATLLACYKRLYTLRRASNQVVHTASTAALILVYAIVSRIAVEGHDDLLTPLDICCSALADLGQAFGNASRALDILLAVKRSWQAKLLAKT